MTALSVLTWEVGVHHVHVLVHVRVHVQMQTWLGVSQHVVQYASVPLQHVVQYASVPLNSIPSMA